MKKTILVSLACLLSLGVTGCGQSDEAKADQLIQSIQNYDKMSASDKKAFEETFENDLLSLPEKEQQRVKKAWRDVIYKAPSLDEIKELSTPKAKF